MALQENQFNKPVGKLGNFVYYFWGEDYLKRAYVKPVQPWTALQLTRAQKFRNGVMAWQALTVPQKEAYNVRADPLKMSGFNLFMSEYMKA